MLRLCLDLCIILMVLTISVHTLSIRYRRQDIAVTGEHFITASCYVIFILFLLLNFMTSTNLNSKQSYPRFMSSTTIRSPHTG